MNTNELRTFKWQLNRLAGTLVNDQCTVDEQAAANIFAGTKDLALVAALNARAGTQGLGLRGVCNLIGQTQDLDEVRALAAAYELYGSGSGSVSVFDDRVFDDDYAAVTPPELFDGDFGSDFQA